MLVSAACWATSLLCGPQQCVASPIVVRHPSTGATVPAQRNERVQGVTSYETAPGTFAVTALSVDRVLQRGPGPT